MLPCFWLRRLPRRQPCGHQRRLPSCTLCLPPGGHTVAICGSLWEQRTPHHPILRWLAAASSCCCHRARCSCWEMRERGSLVLSWVGCDLACRQLGISGGALYPTMQCALGGCVVPVISNCGGPYLSICLPIHVRRRRRCCSSCWSRPMLHGTYAGPLVAELLIGWGLQSAPIPSVFSIQFFIRRRPWGPNWPMLHCMPDDRSRNRWYVLFTCTRAE